MCARAHHLRRPRIAQGLGGDGLVHGPGGVRGLDRVVYEGGLPLAHAVLGAAELVRCGAQRGVVRSLIVNLLFVFVMFAPIFCFLSTNSKYTYKYKKVKHI